MRINDLYKLIKLKAHHLLGKTSFVEISNKVYLHVPAERLVAHLLFRRTLRISPYLFVATSKIFLRTMLS